MGLAGPKRRSKISHDPNNTGWSTSSDGYGQKILSAQGWKPGDYLGATNASHADHYTAANRSHIKVLLREDNLGLGASLGKSNADTFGLSLYAGVLSRLNGNDGAEVEKQQKAIRDAELRTYQATKYGFMNFVSGGVLVGDTMEAAGKKSEGAQKRVAASDDEIPACVKKQKVDTATPIDGASIDDIPGKRERKRSKEHRKEKDKSRSTRRNPRTTEANKDHISMEEQESATKEKSSKKRKHRLEEDQSVAVASLQSNHQSDMKLEKRQRKEERRKKREERHRVKGADAASLAKKAEQTSSHSAATANPTPANAGRLAVRQRYIQQKRLASLNPQAMKEIFMFA